MKLERGKEYKAGDGVTIIPRSKFSEDYSPKYAVFEIRTFESNGHYTMRHTTLTKAEIREILKLEKRSAIAII